MALLTHRPTYQELLLVWAKLSGQTSTGVILCGLVMIRGDFDAKAVTIIRADLTATGLRQAAAGSNDANAARRMLRLALVLEGYARGEAARLCGMDRQTLRDWVIRYNAEGVAGLSDRTSPGPKPRLTPEQEAAVAELVRKGPDLAKDGVG